MAMNYNSNATSTNWTKGNVIIDDDGGLGNGGKLTGTYGFQVGGNYPVKDLPPEQRKKEQEIMNEIRSRMLMNEASTSLSGNDLVGLNANAIDDLQTLLKSYRDGIYKYVVTLSDNSIKLSFGNSLESKLKSYAERIVEVCVDFLNAFEPFSVKIDYVAEAYEKAKKTHKDQVGGFMSATGLMVQDGVIDDTHVSGIDNRLKGYDNPNVNVSVISKDAMPEKDMTVDEIVAYWTSQGRLGNGDARKKKCEELGLDYYAIQDKINENYGYGPTTKPEGYKPTEYKTQEEYDAEVRRRSNIGNTADAESQAFEIERHRREAAEATKKTTDELPPTTTGVTTYAGKDPTGDGNYVAWTDDGKYYYIDSTGKKIYQLKKDKNGHTVKYLPDTDIPVDKVYSHSGQTSTANGEVYDDKGNKLNVTA